MEAKHSRARSDDPRVGVPSEGLLTQVMNQASPNTPQAHHLPQ